MDGRVQSFFDHVNDLPHYSSSVDRNLQPRRDEELMFSRAATLTTRHLCLNFSLQ